MSNPRLGSWFIVIRNNTNNAILCIDTFSFHISTSLSKNHLHNEYYLVILHNFKIMTIIHSEPSGIHSISIEMNLGSKTGQNYQNQNNDQSDLYSYSTCRLYASVTQFFFTNNYTQGRQIDHRNKYWTGSSWVRKKICEEFSTDILSNLIKFGRLWLGLRSQ